MDEHRVTWATEDYATVRDAFNAVFAAWGVPPERRMPDSAEAFGSWWPTDEDPPTYAQQVASWTTQAWASDMDAAAVALGDTVERNW